MIQLVNYSEKAFTITGNTKPIKDLLKQLKGKWNPKIGWVFSKIHLTIVKDTLTKTEKHNIIHNKIKEKQYETLIDIDNFVIKYNKKFNQQPTEERINKYIYKKSN